MIKYLIAILIVITVAIVALNYASANSDSPTITFITPAPIIEGWTAEPAVVVTDPDGNRVACTVASVGFKDRWVLEQGLHAYNCSVFNGEIPLLATPERTLIPWVKK